MSEETACGTVCRRVQKNASMFLLATLALLLLVNPSPSQNNWPIKPIRVISPIGPGSAADILARTVSEQLAAQLGQPLVVENRPGAGGTLGANAVAKADADGYTILIHSVTHAIAPAAFASLPYDPVGDFAAVTPLANFPSLLVVAPSKKIGSVQELVSAARKNTGALNYASGGVGTPPHLNAERFRLSAGFEAQHVPFKSLPEALTEVMTGRVDFYFVPAFPALPLIKEGRLLALAVSSAKRLASLPDVPTTVESGFPNSEYNFWVGMFVPAKTPRDIIARLHSETVKALAVPSVREKLAKLEVEPMSMTPEQFQTYVKEEIDLNAVLAKAAGIRQN